MFIKTMAPDWTGTLQPSHWPVNFLVFVLDEANSIFSSSAGPSPADKALLVAAHHSRGT
jgi:hypothetical protein